MEQAKREGPPWHGFLERKSHSKKEEKVRGLSADNLKIPSFILVFSGKSRWYFEGAVVFLTESLTF
jgi:hypothetical protein